MTSITPDDHQLAASLAYEAGELLVGLRARLHAEGAPPALLRAQGDRQAHELLLTRLSIERPEDCVLSEEATDNTHRSARITADRVWIVDPLDGTREFGMPGCTDWAVHVALVTEQVPVAAAVALPALGAVLSTADPPSLPLSARVPPRMVVSRSRADPVVLRAAQQLGAETMTMGSAGAKAMAVVRGDCEIYAHAGGQFEWDSCAPSAVAAAAGCHVSRLDGSALRYNQADVWLPDLVICRPELAEALLSVLASAPT